MSEERTTRAYDEQKAQEVGCLVMIFARLAQVGTGLIGGALVSKDVIEHGVMLSNSLALAFTLGIILGIQQMINSDSSGVHDAYHEPGVVDD